MYDYKHNTCYVKMKNATSFENIKRLQRKKNTKNVQRQKTPIPPSLATSTGAGATESCPVGSPVPAFDQS